MGKFIDLTGKKFGRLKVIKRVYNKNRIAFLCKCECGNEKNIRSNDLRSGNTTSCGCFKKDVLKNNNFAVTHKLSQTRFYKIWAGMKTRVVDKHKKYIKNGIKVCAKWHSFDNFKSDMYNSYIIHYKKFRNNTTIDRINNNGNYCKSNCRWATVKKQCRNKNNNHLLTYNSKTQTVTEWAEDIKINRYVLFDRILTLKWSIKKALETPVRGIKK